MSKLRSMRIQAFRGVVDELRLDFSRKNRSVALYGPNATGKSTIADALEWFFTNQIGHLWSEDCKTDSLRNILASEKDDTAVEISFDDSDLNSSKCLTTKGRTKHSNSNELFATFLDKSSKERILLRHADVASFVISTKSEKRQEIEKIIGYDAVRKFRDAIRGTKTKLEKDPDYLLAVKTVEEADNELLNLSGETIGTNQQLLRKFNDVFRGHLIEIDVVDSASYQEALQSLKEQLGDPTRAKQVIQYDALKKEIEATLETYKKFLCKRNSFLQEYSVFISDSSVIAKVKLEAFLKAGYSVLAETDSDNEKCPFCFSPFDIDILKQNIVIRIKEIEELNGRYTSISAEKADFVFELQELTRSALNLSGFIDDFVQDKQFADAVVDLQQELPVIGDRIEKCFGILDKVEVDCAILEKAIAVLQLYSDSIEDKVKSLTLSESENKALESYQIIIGMSKAFNQRTRNKQVVDTFRLQLNTLEDIYESFVEVQNTAVQKVLDAISEDVNLFFNKLLPSSSIDKVRLKLLGEQGIEFEYSFHGVVTHPPKKYLSESYLNCLGIVLFLASAKLFNSQCQFFILDDIVTSFDSKLRRMLIRLLKQEFFDWQIVLLTHEEFWFKIMQRELANSGWIFHKVAYSAELGTTLDSRPVDLRSSIQSKLDAGNLSGNDLRIFLESSLKEICFRLKVLVEYRANEINEDRMSGELLSSLRNTLSRKNGKEILNTNVLQNLEGSSLVINKDSHDSSESVEEEDLRVVLEDIDKLLSIFVCSHCNNWIDANNTKAGVKVITCKCGLNEIAWN